MNDSQSIEKRRKRNLTFAINLSIRKEEDTEKLVRTLHNSIRKAGRTGIVQIFINNDLAEEVVPPKSKSAPKRTSKERNQHEDDQSLLD